MVEENKPTMMTYIKEEQEVLSNILKNYPDNCPVIKGNNWLILETGSSINAAYSAKYYIEKILDVYLTIEEPFKFHYYEKLKEETDNVIGISQSGESTSTIDALKAIKKLKPELTMYGLTSKRESELAQVVNEVIEIENGIERVGYVTKGFTATIFKLMLSGLKTAKNKGLISEQEEAKELSSFEKAINKISDIIEKTENFYEKWSEKLGQAERFTSLCTGALIGTEMEMQTKFSETIRIPSQGMDIEVFMHGPYFEVNSKHQHFYIDSNSPMNQRLFNLRDYEKRYVGQVYTISLNKSQNDSELGLELEIDEYKAGLFIIIPFQILAHHIAEARGNHLSQRIYTDFGLAMKSKTKPGDYA